MNKIAIAVFCLAASSSAASGGHMILEGSLGSVYPGQSGGTVFRLEIPLTPPVGEYHYQRPRPRPDYGQWHRPPHVLHHRPPGSCPAGTREFFTRAWDSLGNTYYVFQGCR